MRDGDCASGGGEGRGEEGGTVATCAIMGELSGEGIQGVRKGDAAPLIFSPPIPLSPPHRMREVETELSDERKRSARLAAWAVAAVESSGRGVGPLPPPPLGPARGKAAVLSGGGGVAGSNHRGATAPGREVRALTWRCPVPAWAPPLPFLYPPRTIAHKYKYAQPCVIRAWPS